MSKLQSGRPPRPWAPLAQPAFRMLWLVWLTSNVCMWMSDITAAWLMASMTTSATMVALVQSASTLPIFMLGLPGGALADILDRRRHFIAIQMWASAVACVLTLVLAFDRLSAPLLLMLTFANSVGLALRWPVFVALVPETLPRHQLPGGLVLNGLAMHVGCVGGSVLAGVLIAHVGSVWVYGLNTLLWLMTSLALLHWRRSEPSSTLPREPLVGAIRTGLQFVAHSAGMRTAMACVAVFFFTSTALPALLPLLARRLGGGSAMFTSLLACMGAGAVVAALALPRLRRSMSPNSVIRFGTLMHSCAMLLVALAPGKYAMALGMALAGVAAISVANSLSVAAQLTLPDWVRARGMSFYQVAMMGAAAIGAVAWGQLATYTNVQISLASAAFCGIASTALLYRLNVLHRLQGDPMLTGDDHRWAAETNACMDAGPVRVTVEYLINPDSADQYCEAMYAVRRTLSRQGAREWTLWRDVDVPGRYVEQFVHESWGETLRRGARMTEGDSRARERADRFHIGVAAPAKHHCIAERLLRPVSD